MFEIFSADSLSMISRLICAIFLGGLIGFERETHGRPAGFRTHILVCMGAAMIMIVTGLFSKNTDTDMINPIVVDPGRIVAGIVTGIGFLGAGAIIRMGDIVRGLTTAASIWFTASLGIVIGDGHFLLAMVATVLALLVLSCFSRVERLIPTRIYRSIVIQIDGDMREETEKQVHKILSDLNIHIQEKLYGIDKMSGEMEIGFHIRTKHPHLSEPTVTALMDLEHVKSVRWELEK